ncbi:MAG: hypothetical protein HQK51_20050 [Oligoflexia bacterium]|nr:hypothetical protein [Oligoflexia bacterium]
MFQRIEKNFKYIQAQKIRWALVFFAIFIACSIILYTYSNKYIDGGNDIKHEISAEIYKNVIFSENISNLHKFSQETYGQNKYNLSEKFGSATTDRMPLYFLYLAIIKKLGCSFILYGTINILLLLTCVLIFTEIFNIKSRGSFFFIGSFLLSPFFVFQSLIYEPHIWELFIFVVGIYFFHRKLWTWSFYFIVLSLFFHRGNAVLIFCITSYFLVINLKNWMVILKAIGGGIAAWLSVELFLFFLYSKDVNGMLLHKYMFDLLFLKVSGGLLVAKDSGFIGYWKNVLLFFPISFFGLLWIKGRFQFVLTLFPIIFYFVLFGFRMPGAHRVLLPVFFIAQMYFLNNYFQLSESSNKAKYISILIMTTSFISYFAYYSYVHQCPDLGYQRTVMIDDNSSDRHSSFSKANLYRNLKRYDNDVVVTNANVKFKVKEEDALATPNFPTPYDFYPFAARKFIFGIFGEEIFYKIGSFSREKIFKLEITEINAQK